MEEKQENSIDRLIDTLYMVHRDNSQQQYFAEKGKHRISIMPLTPFVFEFFLFNSLYQVDWNKSYEENKLIFHPDTFKETKQQSEFVKYLKTYAKENPSDLYRAFESLLYLPKIEGEWTNVKPDARISQERGKKFFEKIKTLQQIIESCKYPNDMLVTKKVFEIISECIFFIYLLRNNIFHGSKALGDIYEENQKLRIELYELFLKGVTSLFFLSVGKDAVASDFIPCPITSNVLPVFQDQEILDLDTVWSAINRGLLKSSDTRLIAQFTKQIVPPRISASDNNVLFYPSAGTDLLTPILLGLPYCTEFYFYERGQISGEPPRVYTVLKKLPTVRFNDGLQWKHQDNVSFFDFEYDGISRRIHWVHSDNTDFLKLDVKLGFYFHRGDSWGRRRIYSAMGFRSTFKTEKYDSNR